MYFITTKRMLEVCFFQHTPTFIIEPFFNRFICTCFLKNKKIKKISKKVLTFFLVYPIIQNVPRMRQTKQRKTTNQAPLAQLVEQ